MLDVVRNISIDWNYLVENILVYTTEKESYYVDGQDIVWDNVPQYPSCQTIDLMEYFDFDSYTPLEVLFYVAQVENFGITIHFEDRNTVLSRKLKSNMLAYSGPAFQNLDLFDPIKIRGIFKFSQTINSEKDEAKNCKNYPNKAYKSYKECDLKYLHSLFRNYYKIMPVWVTGDHEKVTKSK